VLRDSFLSERSNENFQGFSLLLESSVISAFVCVEATFTSVLHQKKVSVSRCYNIKFSVDVAPQVSEILNLCIKSI
jgi:hypothetical protein